MIELKRVWLTYLLVICVFKQRVGLSFGILDNLNDVFVCVLNYSVSCRLLTRVRIRPSSSLTGLSSAHTAATSSREGWPATQPNGVNCLLCMRVVLTTEYLLACPNGVACAAGKAGEGVKPAGNS